MRIRGATRHFTVVQWPCVDIRPLLRTATARLASPTWPDPRVGEEFVRGVGVVLDRPRGPIFGWPGEQAFVDASRLLRFAGDPFDGGTPPLVPRYRRLFATNCNYRVDVAGEVRIALPVGVESGRAAATRCLGADVVIDGRTVSLATAGDALCPAILRRTSAHSMNREGGPATGWVTPGLPAVLVEVASPFVQGPLLSASSVTHGAHRIPIFMITNPRAPLDDHRLIQRQVRGSLWRLHTQIEMFRGVMRAWQRSPQAFDLVELKDFLDRILTSLARERRDGVNQPALVALHRYFTGFDSTELARWAEDIRAESLGLARKVDVLLERSERAMDVPRYAVSAEKINLFQFTWGDVVGAKNEFNFSGPASGVFGSDNEVSGCNFSASAPMVPQEVIELLFAQLGELRGLVPEDEVAELDTLEAELRSAKVDDREGFVSTVRKIANKATSLGAIAVPVLETARKVLTAAGIG